MGLIRKVFWVALTVIFTVLFTVLFEHGTTDYLKNLEKDIKELRDAVRPVERKKDTSDKIPPK